VRKRLEALLLWVFYLMGEEAAIGKFNSPRSYARVLSGDFPSILLSMSGTQLVGNRGQRSLVPKLSPAAGL
jgi:hypothetical protein